MLHVRVRSRVGPNRRQHIFGDSAGEEKNKSVAMTGIPKPSEVDSANIRRPNVQQLPAEHQKILDDIQKKI